MSEHPAWSHISRHKSGNPFSGTKSIKGLLLFAVDVIFKLPLFSAINQTHAGPEAEADLDRKDDLKLSNEPKFLSIAAVRSPEGLFPPAGVRIRQNNL